MDSFRVELNFNLSVACGDCQGCCVPGTELRAQILNREVREGGREVREEVREGREKVREGRE